MNSDEPDLLAFFIQEATEHLETLETDLVALEVDPLSSATLNRLFRAIHSIKGTAGFFGLTAITELGHLMESVMALLRDRRIEVTPALISLFLAATDTLKRMVSLPEKSGEVSSLMEREALGALLVTVSPVISDPEALPALPFYLEAFRIDPGLVRSALSHGQNIYAVSVRLQADIEAQGSSILDYFKEVESLGRLIDSVTDFGPGPGLSGNLREEAFSEVVCSLLMATEMESALLMAVFNLPAEQVVQISSDRLQRWLLTQPIIEPASPVTQFLSPRPLVVEDNKREPLLRGRTGRAKAEKTVRISVSLLETLDRLTAELVFTHHQLLSLVTATDRWEPLPACAQSIGALTSNLQRTLLEARLQSVETLFTKFTRVVRDLGQKLGKDVHLETEGAEIALDRVLIEGLSDPLAHLIRNALDHGIEAVAERRGTGKEATGQVKISVSIFSKYVQIEVRDDGRGLNPNRLKAKAVEQILITAEQAERLTAVEAWQLIFAPGFSTALAVTDVSGRGVGMDVVKTNIEQLGGQVDIKSVLGEGTSVLIRLPLTLAMIPALIVNSGSVHFAVQQPSVEAIIELDKESPLETLGSGQFFHFREEKVPVFTLSTLLDLPASIAAENPGHLLLLKSDGCRFGLLVETKGVAQRILLKPLDESQQKLAFYLGSTVSETGETLFVLDLAALITSRLAVKDEA